MATTTELTGLFSRVCGERADDVRSDGDLLREYVKSRSDAAFTELVRRFAPMVWGVCHRTVGHLQRAEDAFQAVFLVLVRKPDSIRPPAAVGGWLHAVALRTSLRARAMAERRRQWECSGAKVPDRAAPDGPESPDPDLVRMLDEEIARLPNKLRAAVALCELGGLSRRDAAKRLEIAEGTLSSRLAAARQQLAARLRARGATLGAGGIAAGLGVGPAAATVPRISSAVSEHVSELADGVLRTMFLSKLRLVMAGVAVALALVGGVLAASEGEPSDPPRTALPVAHRSAPVPKIAVREETIFIWVDEKLRLLKPDGTEQRSLVPIPKEHFDVEKEFAQLSPDGTQVAFAMKGAEVKQKLPLVAGGLGPIKHRRTLKVLDTGVKKEAKEVETVHAIYFHWLPDNKSVYVWGSEIGADAVLSGDLESWVYTPATGKRVPFKVPADFIVHTFGPDGKTALVEERKSTLEQWHQRVHLWTVGTVMPMPLLERNHSLIGPSPKFSPDGKRLLCEVIHFGEYKPKGNGNFEFSDLKFNNVIVVDLETKKQTVVKELGTGQGSVFGLAWSPNGKKIAYVEVEGLLQQAGAPMAHNLYRVMVADPDGKNAKEIYKTTGDRLIEFDWK